MKYFVTVEYHCKTSGFVGRRQSITTSTTCNTKEEVTEYIQRIQDHEGTDKILRVNLIYGEEILVKIERKKNVQEVVTYKTKFSIE